MRNKFQEIIAKLRKQNKSVPISEEQFAETMELMNESVEKTREKFLLQQDQARRKAEKLIVR